MTPTEMGRRSDSLYMDTNNMHRRQLCEMIVHREADIEELKEEIYGLHCDIGRLEVENDKLRELVRDMYLCSDETCTDCEHHDYSGEGFWCKRGVGWKRARMRELGVEVEA